LVERGDVRGFRRLVVLERIQLQLDVVFFVQLVVVWLQLQFSVVVRLELQLGLVVRFEL